jgi:outer membrane protein TolC
MKFPAFCVRRACLVCCVILSASATKAQSQIAALRPAPSLPSGPLSLEDALGIAFANQGDVLAAQKQLSASTERITVARSARAPQLLATIGTNYLNTSSTISSFNPGTIPIPVNPGTGTGGTGTGGTGTGGTGTGGTGTGGTGTGTPTGTGTGTGGTGTGVGTGTNTGTSTVYSSTGTTTTTGLALTQNLFDSGRVRESVRQSRALQAITRGNLGTTRINLAYAVAQRFFEQLRQATLVAQRQNQLVVASQSLNQIQAQITAGTSPRSDLLGAQVNVSQARFDLTTARNALRTAQVDLRQSLGLETGAPLELQSALAPPPEPAPTEELLRLARTRRPDLASAGAQITQSQSQLRSAQIEARPSVAANLNLNLDPRRSRNRNLGIGATLSIPLFDAGGRRASVRAARDELEAARLRLGQLQKSADAQVQGAAINVSGQIARVEVARELVASAQNNLDVARGRYSAGVGIALDITTAQSQLFQAQTSLTGAQFDLQVGLANLDLATGRYAVDEPLGATGASATGASATGASATGATSP